MSTNPENTTPVTNVDEKKDRKKKLIGFAKELGKVFTSNTVAGAGLGLGMTTAVVLVIRLAEPKITLRVPKNTTEASETE